MKKINYLLFAIVVIFSACSKDNDNNQNQGIGKGFFVLNEGTFTYANASLSFFNEDSLKITNNLFFRVNNVPLGDVANSMTHWNNKLYLVVNNSGYIYKVDEKTILYESQLAGMHSPREILIISDTKAYVSDLYEMGFHVINPSTMEYIRFVRTGKSTENMLLLGDEVFITNWSQYEQQMPNNTVQIVDSKTDQVIDSVIVTKEPNSMVVDANGKLWVLCSGGWEGEETPALIQIDPQTRTIIKKLDFDALSYPSRLSINKQGDRLYYINSDVFTLTVEDSHLPEEPLIEAGKHYFYNIALHPQTATLVLADGSGFAEKSYVFRYHDDGRLIDSVQAGIMPNKIVFNY
ncbi:MAG: hypothetical protein LBM67_06835 [Lentimicrobiaceae bacterium]|jgi:YVTN family beta-propeller protein|nr:hypothetical protein [Lentimicrobiaceae bacterium]